MALLAIHERVRKGIDVPHLKELNEIGNLRRGSRPSDAEPPSIRSLEVGGAGLLPLDGGFAGGHEGELIVAEKCVAGVRARDSDGAEEGRQRD
jgi:hypothetical protein